MTDDPIAYARQALAGNPAVIALLDEVERGQERRVQAHSQRPDPPPVAGNGRRRADGRIQQRDDISDEPRSGYTWCIACQAMVPYAGWPLHVAHSQASLRHRREQS